MSEPSNQIPQAEDAVNETASSEVTTVLPDTTSGGGLKALTCGKDGCGCLIKHRNPRILLMGQRQAGKTSIVEVIFRHLPPEETLFVDPTTKMHKGYITSFVSFVVYDSPGQKSFLELSFDITGIFDNIDTVVWVIDAQSEWVDSLLRFHRTLIILKRRFPKMNIEVFIHKVEDMSAEYALEIKEDIVRRTEEMLTENDLPGDGMRYYLTSIYDRSVWQAFSKVLQIVTPRVSAVEELLDALCQSIGMLKILLFDVNSKIYIATDRSPVDIQVLAICIEQIEFVAEWNAVFGYPRKNFTGQNEEPGYNGTEASSTTTLENGMKLYMREINTNLVIVGLFRHQTMTQRNTMACNIAVFQRAVLKITGVPWVSP